MRRCGGSWRSSAANGWAWKSSGTSSAARNARTGCGRNWPPPTACRCVATNGVLHADPGRPRGPRCLHLHPPPHASGCRGHAAFAQRRAASQARRGDGGPVRRSPRGGRKHRPLCRTARVRAGKPRLRIPVVSGAAGGNDGHVSAEAHLVRRAAALRRHFAGGARAARPGAGAHRQAGLRRIFPGRLGHLQFLPGAEHPRAGPRLGRQQRGLLCARHHGHRSGRRAPALRAVPQRGPVLLAGHRSRSARAATAASGSSRRSTAATPRAARR